MLEECMYISLLMSRIKITGLMLLEMLLMIERMSYQVLYLCHTICKKYFLITITTT